MNMVILTSSSTQGRLWNKFFQNTFIGHKAFRVCVVSRGWEWNELCLILQTFLQDKELYNAQKSKYE